MKKAIKNMRRLFLVAGTICLTFLMTMYLPPKGFSWAENRLLALALKRNYDDGGYTVVAPMTSIDMFDTIFLGGGRFARFRESILKNLKDEKALKDCDVNALFKLFIRRNAASVSLTLDSAPANGYSVDYSGKFGAYFIKDGGGWERLREENPLAHGMTRVSVPVVDSESGIVLLYLGTQYQSLMGIGFLIVYKYDNGQLTEITRLRFWIS